MSIRRRARRRWDEETFTKAATTVPDEEELVTGCGADAALHEEEDHGWLDDEFIPALDNDLPHSLKGKD